MARLESRPIARERSEFGSTRSPGDSDCEPDWLSAPEVRESALTPYLPERWRNARLDPGRRGLVALCAVGILVVVVAVLVLMRDAPVVAPVPSLPVVQPISDNPAANSRAATGATSDGAPPDPPAPPSTIVVSVVGLVRNSGLVHLPPGSRIADALAAAGGTLDGADVLALNLAARLDDGAQIVVGVVPPEGLPIVSGTTPGATGPPSPGGGTAAGGKVDLNSATVEQLDGLSGVGPVTAASIVSWREVNGPFTDVAQLAEVDGIGPARLDKLRDQVTV